jgi:hypothetical protein
MKGGLYNIKGRQFYGDYTEFDPAEKFQNNNEGYNDLVKTTLELINMKNETPVAPKKIHLVHDFLNDGREFNLATRAEKKLFAFRWGSPSCFILPVIYTLLPIFGVIVLLAGFPYAKMDIRSGIIYGWLMALLVNLFFWGMEKWVDYLKNHE